MRCHNRICAALKAAKGNPILSIGGQLYITGVNDFTEIAILWDREEYGRVTLLHLNRLGNANHAVASDNELFKRKLIDWL